MLSGSVDPELFKPHAAALIDLMIDLMENQAKGQDGDGEDPLGAYLLSAWQKICMILG